MATVSMPQNEFDAELDRERFIKAWSPSEIEESYEITDVEGEIPREINGTLYRNGPSQRIMPKAGYSALHLFDGDALVHAFRFEDGKAHYTGKFVENDSYLNEQAAGKFNQNGTGVICDPADRTDEVFMREQHNTNIVHHGGKLMALVENSWPFQLDERTLAPIGKTDFGVEQLGMSVTAHPKIDGKTGQMIIHGYQPFDPMMQLYIVEPDGKASLAETIDVPWSSMMHDIAITENYVVILMSPAVLDPEKLMNPEISFTDSLSWEPERGFKFGVKKREQGAPVQWFDVPTTAFIFHPGNAFERDGKIIMDACTYLNPQKLFDSLASWRSGEVIDGALANPFSYELDLANGLCTEKQLDDRSSEFPRLDDRLVGYENRFGYALLGKGGSKSLNGWLDVCKYDRTGGPNEIHDFGDGQFANEPVFVPRSADAEEDDGFVLNVVYDAPNDASYLSVLDARNVAGKPVAKAHLKHRIPLGFHGSFAGGVV